MRKITIDQAESQVQVDDEGREYVYRKDFVGGGNMTTEYSLSLMYMKNPARSFIAPAMPQVDNQQG